MLNHALPRRPRTARAAAARTLSATIASALIAAGTAAVGLATATPASADSGATSSTASPAAATAAALAKAKSSGQAVDIPALTTPTQTVAAEPTGLLALTESVYPTRVKRGNAWLPVDAALHAAPDGSLVPAAVPSGITLSGGGTTPLATLTSYGKRLAISWPASLPKPTLSGATATYAEVFPGVDLKVTVSPLGGMSEVLVVKSAEAATNPELSSLQLRTSTSGLQVSSDTSGNLQAEDPTGAAFFTSPAAMMWDSSTTTAAGTASAPMARSAQADGADETPAAPPAASSAQGPGTGAQTGQVDTQVTSGKLTLTPDGEVLHGADTRYPVYIDPDWNPNYAPATGQGYDEIQESCPDSNHLNSTTTPYNTPGVGQNGYSGCIGVEEAYFQFKVDTRLWDSSVKITAATFKATELYAANLNCSYTSNVQVKLSGAISTSTTWHNRPSLSTLQDTKAFGSTCTTNPSQGFDVSDALGKAASGHWKTVTFGMVASDESNALNFRRFANNPTVTVQYDSVPSVSSATTSPSTVCSGGTTIGHTSTTLNAYVSDNDPGAPVQSKFTLTGKSSSGTVVYPVSGVTGPGAYEPQSTVTGHGNITWQAGYLPTGTYTWTAQADDGKYLSATKTCSFKVDATAPGTPTITSPVFDNGNAVPQHTAAEFDFHPPVDTAGKPTTDLAYYAYSWGTPPAPVNPRLTVAAAAGGAVTKITLTPGGYIHNVLYVYAVDNAGNESKANHYDFDTQPPEEADATGDLSGDGHPDLVVAGPNGNVRLYQGDGQGGLASALDISTGGGFAGAKITVGGFRMWGEQDILAVTSNGQAHIYFGNGDAEPLPSFAPTDADVPAIAPQDAVLSPDSLFTWAQASQIVAADDAQGDQPSLWVVTADGTLWWVPATYSTGTFDTPVQVATGWQTKTLTYAGMLNGFPALWVRDTATGELDLYTGSDNITAGSPTSTKTVASASGWTGAAHPQIFSAGVNTSGVPALWSTDSQSVRNILYYPGGSASGSLGSGVREQTLNPSDDFTGDGQADIAAQWGDGTLHMYTGEGGGQLTNGAQIWDSGWNTVTAMVSGDFTGDGTSDVVARWNDGTLHRYDGTGTGALNLQVPLFSESTSWNIVREMTAGDFNGDGAADLVAVWNDGTLHLYTNTGHGEFNQPVSFWPTSSSWAGMRLLSGGDYNGDGNGDILAIQVSTGALRLYKGDGNSQLTTPVTSGSLNWTGIRDIIPGDFSGDGKADLAVIMGSGALHLFTGNGAGAFTDTGSMWRDTSWSTIKLAT